MQERTLKAKSSKLEAIILYGATDFGAAQFSADLLWRTKFRVPDPVAAVDTGGSVTLFVSALEYGRAKTEAQVDDVRLLSDEPFEKQLLAFLAGFGLKRVSVAASFPLALAEKLRSGIEVVVHEGPLYLARARKTPEEISAIEASQRAAGRAINVAREFLKSCRVKDGLVYAGDEPATSEGLQKLINDELYCHGFLGLSTIAASGVQAADPHATGSGPLAAHAPIVLDVFPVSLTTHYYGDMTRTLFKGEPSPEFARMYETVREAQEAGIGMVKAGECVREIYESVVQSFEQAKYPTGADQDGAHGFIHGLGHGVGLEVHEEPRVGRNDAVLEEGSVITIEPGLYYAKPRENIPSGGVRIEDIVVVEKNGARELAALPRDLGWAVVS